MILSNYFNQLQKSEKFNSLKYSALNKILEHKSIIEMAMTFSKSISCFAQTKSALSFIEGSIGIVDNLARALGGYSSDYFEPSNNWNVLAYSNTPIYDILNPTLKKFPFRQLKFAHEIDPAIIYSTKIGEIAKIKSGIFYKSKVDNKNHFLEFLIQEKIKNLNSTFFSITETASINSGGSVKINYDLRGEKLLGLHSNTSRQKAEQIKFFLDQGFNRSVLYKGVPGAGKTVCAQSIVELLNLRTLKFTYKLTTDLNAIMLLIKYLNIQAVILDDFVPFADLTTVLNFLEWLHQNVRLMIITTNSLKSFPPALTRPGRISSLETINKLDNEIVKEVLGNDLYEKVGKQVEEWPIAYIVEMKNRILSIPDLDVAANIKELASRVKEQKNYYTGN